MKKLVSDLNVQGKRVLVRVDFNVPHKGETVTDDNRVRAAIPTIADLLRKGAKVILMSHLGKIKWGKVDDAEIENEKKKNDLKIVLPALKEHLAEALGKEVKVSFSEATHGEALKAAVDALGEGEVLLAQNTRYEKGETKNNEELSKEWASLADAYVMDAFGSAHRAHSSTVGVPTILAKEGKETAVGYLVEEGERFFEVEQSAVGVFVEVVILAHTPVSVRQIAFVGQVLRYFQSLCVGVPGRFVDIVVEQKVAQPVVYRRFQLGVFGSVQLFQSLTIEYDGRVGDVELFHLQGLLIERFGPSGMVAAARAQPYP